MIFAHACDGAEIWRKCRPVSRTLKAAVEVYISTTFLLKNVRLTYESIGEDRKKTCFRTTFKKYSADHRWAYFDMAPVAPVRWSYKDASPDDQLLLQVRSRPVRVLPKRSEKQTLRDGTGARLDLESNHVRGNFSIRRWYRIIRPEHPDATISYDEDLAILLGLDLDKKVIFFDWIQAMTQVLRKTQRLSALA